MGKIMNPWKILNFSICILLVFVFCTGCTQKNTPTVTISGVYLNEANNLQYITFGNQNRNRKFSEILYLRSSFNRNKTNKNNF